ncbi:MAG: aldehyde dehydrogenase family protein, partial [Bradymonadia bacterium]
TAHTIRTHPRVLETGALVNIEADSLNATVLGPNVEDETYDAFIRDVHREMTQKSGQKCTATRRIFVPMEKIDEVIEDLGEKLATTRVGDPNLDGVHMGPLASMSQKTAALEGLELLLSQGTIAYGHPTEGSLVGADSNRGAFILPTLIRTDDSSAQAHVHNVEVFGPVASVIGYDGTAADVSRLISYGQGCLVTAVYGDDRTFLAECIADSAAWNGRLVLTDAKIAAKSYAPGMVLPHLLHGGPGRAGGGEELGGTRGLRIYQQRTAIQGNGPLIAKLLGAD